MGEVRSEVRGGRGVLVLPTWLQNFLMVFLSWGLPQ